MEAIGIAWYRLKGGCKLEKISYAPIEIMDNMIPLVGWLVLAMVHYNFSCASIGTLSLFQY